MASADIITGGRGCLPSRATMQLDRLREPASCLPELLAQALHKMESGVPRPHARADRLATALADDRVRIRRIMIPWAPPAGPLHELKALLRRVGSPGVAEGHAHAWLRVAAYVVAAATAGPGDRVLLEARTPSDRRLDVVVQRGQAPVLGFECGSIAGDTVLEHLRAGGLRHLVVVPFAALNSGTVIELEGWPFSRCDSAPLTLPTTEVIAARYAMLDRLAPS